MRLVVPETVTSHRASIPRQPDRRDTYGGPPDHVPAGNDKGDDYASRVLKYVPAETVAFYLAAIGFVPSGGETLHPAAWVPLVLGLLGTIGYLKWQPETGGKRANITVSSIAFLIWAYAIGGPFATQWWHCQWLASLLLISFTFLAGAIRPKPAVDGGLNPP